MGVGGDVDAVHSAGMAASSEPKSAVSSSVGVATGGSHRSTSIAASATPTGSGADIGHAGITSGSIASSIGAGKPPAAPGPTASAAARQAFIDKDDEWVRQVALAEARAGRPIHSGWIPVAQAAAAERKSAALQGAGAGAGSSAGATAATSGSSGGGGGAMVSGGVGSGSSTGMLFDTSAAPPSG